jgi:hypothetical protein
MASGYLGALLVDVIQNINEGYQITEQSNKSNIAILVYLKIKPFSNFQE